MLMSDVFRTEVSTPVTAAVTQPCWLGYSGWLGVVISGDQAGSAVVAALPSRLAPRIAVTGRQ